MRITLTEANRLVDKHETFYKKERKIRGETITIFNYLLQDYEAFDDMNGLGRELRGLTFVGDKPFLSIPKFFNINERPETQEHVLRNKEIKKISRKDDGSMIQPILILGDIYMKSKQSFDNQQAKLAQKIIDENEELKFFILDCFDNNFYPLFELVGPDNHHVIKYPENRLELIMVRSEDGDFIDIDKFDYPDRAESFQLDIDELMDRAKTETGTEGYIVKFTDQSIIKIKTLDYLEKHKVMDELNSYKTIFKRVLQEDLDDVLSLDLTEEDRERLLKMEKCLTDYTVHFIKEIEEIVKKGDSGDREAFVKKHIKHPWFNVIMTGLKGHDIKRVLIDSMLRKYTKEERTKNFLKDIDCLD